jgi:hypothetical protein
LTVILVIENGTSIDTETDLSAEERHVLQKLFLWKDMADSLDQFRQKARQAIQRGWNHSGPIPVSANLGVVLQDLEKKVIRRLRGNQGSCG